MNTTGDRTMRRSTPVLAGRAVTCAMLLAVVFLTPGCDSGGATATVTVPPPLTEEAVEGMTRDELHARLAALARRVRMSVVADNPVVVDGLSRGFADEPAPLEVLVECDTGAGRCGSGASPRAWSRSVPTAGPSAIRSPWA